MLKRTISTAISCIFIFSTTQVNAQYSPYNSYGNPYANNYSSYQYAPRPSTQNNPWSANGYNQVPYPSNYRSAPYRSSPWQNNNFKRNMPWNNSRFSNPMPRSNFSGPWNGRNNGIPVIRGPWTTDNWGPAPWSKKRWDNDPIGDPVKWFKEGPKEGSALMWEDLINAPNKMGKMPGGWTAPSISVPNPVDVGEEFGDAAVDMPGEMRDQSKNFEVNP